MPCVLQSDPKKKTDACYVAKSVFHGWVMIRSRDGIRKLEAFDGEKKKMMTKTRSAVGRGGTAQEKALGPCGG